MRTAEAGQVPARTTLAGVLGRTTVTNLPIYSNEALWKAYAVHACLNPDTHICPPSCYGRLPFPSVPVRLTVRNTVNVAANQALTISFAPFWSKNGDYSTLVAAAYVTGAKLSDQSATPVTPIYYTQKVTDCVPTDQADGSAAPAVAIMGGSVKISCIKSSKLDEDPVFTWTGAGNVKAVQQWNTAMVSPANDWHNLDVPRLQSGLGPVALTTLGSEMPTAPRDIATSFYGILPPVLDEMGRNWYKPCDTIGAGPLTWTAFNTINGTHPIDNSAPMLSINNSSSANAVTIDYQISRVVFVIPKEAALAMNPAIALEEVQFRMPPECATLASSGAAHLNDVFAHRMAIKRSFTHPHAARVHPHVHRTADQAAQEGDRGNSATPILDGSTMARLAGMAANVITTGASILRAGNTVIRAARDAWRGPQDNVMGLELNQNVPRIELVP